MKILVVDDEKLVRWIFERSFSKWGHSVITSGSVKDAVGKLKNEIFDAVFIDMKLPDGTGIAVIDEVRKLNYKPKVIACSAYISSSIEQELREKGINTLAKPFKIQHLKDLIE